MFVFAFASLLHTVNYGDTAVTLFKNGVNVLFFWDKGGKSVYSSGHWEGSSLDI